MKYSWGTCAVAVAAATLAFQSSVRANGYGCSSCGGDAYATQPYCAPACQPCQQQTVQHVHVHKSLFGHHGHHGHHQAPMMMPMVQPMVQVPMAMASFAPVAPVAPVAVERVAFEQPRTVFVERAVAPERLVRIVDTAPAFRVGAVDTLRVGVEDLSRFRSADVNYRSNVNVTSDVDTEALRTAARDLRSGLSEARNLLDQMNNARNDIQLMTQRNALQGEATDAKFEVLQGEVEILKQKFEELRACLQKFSNVPN